MECKGRASEYGYVIHEMNLIIDSTIGIAKEYFIAKNPSFMIFDRLLLVLDPKNWEDSSVFMLGMDCIVHLCYLF